MASANLPFRPFSFNPDESPYTRSMKSIAPSADQPPPGFAASYESKDKPTVPYRNPRRSQLWNDTTREWETAVSETSGSSTQSVGSSNFPRAPLPRSPTFQTPPRLPAFQMPPSPRSPTFRQHTSSPTPPMTKSSKKILQLTGFDPRFERAMPLDHQQLPPPTQPPIPQSPIRSISSNSSGSFYSQAEAGFEYEQNGSIKNSSASIAQSSHDEGELLTSSTYNISERGSKSSNVSKTNSKTKLRNEQAVPQTSVEAIPQAQLQPDGKEEVPPPPPKAQESQPKPRPSNEITSLPGILAQENLRYSNGFEKDTASLYKHSIPTTPSLIPSSVNIQPKRSTSFSNPNPTPTPKTKERTKPSHITLPSKPRKQSLFRTAKDTLEWGIYSPISPPKTPSHAPSPSSKFPTPTSNRKKHTTTPVSPMFSMASDHLSLSPPLGSTSSPTLGSSSSQTPQSPATPNSPAIPRSRRMRFGSGAKHPLKSPFPFPLKFRSQSATSTPSTPISPHGRDPGIGIDNTITEENEDEDQEEAEAANTMPSPSTTRSFGFTRRVSSTLKLKNLSPTSPTSSSAPTKKKNIKRSHPPSTSKFVISNSARRADGPATPMPVSPKSPFLEGVIRGKEVFGRVVGTGLSKEEKRRESLKKRIVVVGITDQSPDGRVAEWL